MHLDPSTNLSFIVKTSGEIVPLMPDDEEFSLQQIRDYVAGPPEVLCKTRDGYLLFHNRDAAATGQAVNPLASSVFSEYSSRRDDVAGRVFLAHPDHIAPYWSRTRRVA
jgi:hypothetical protein